MKVDGLELLRMIRDGEIKKGTIIHDINGIGDIIDTYKYTIGTLSSITGSCVNNILDMYSILGLANANFKILPNENVDEIEELPIYELEQPNDPVWYNRHKINELVRAYNKKGDK